MSWTDLKWVFVKSAKGGDLVSLKKMSDRSVWRVKSRSELVEGRRRIRRKRAAKPFEACGGKAVCD
jgi:hypothetical protein